VYFTALSSRFRIIRLIRSSSPFKAIDGESVSNFNRTPFRKASTVAARAQSLTASFNETCSLFKAARVFIG
jgi:hypothetical protein